MVNVMQHHDHGEIRAVAPHKAQSRINTHTGQSPN